MNRSKSWQCVVKVTRSFCWFWAPTNINVSMPAWNLIIQVKIFKPKALIKKMFRERDSTISIRSKRRRPSRWRKTWAGFTVCRRLNFSHYLKFIIFDRSFHAGKFSESRSTRRKRRDWIDGSVDSRKVLLSVIMRSNADICWLLWLEDWNHWQSTDFRLRKFSLYSSHCCIIIW